MSIGVCGSSLATHARTKSRKESVSRRSQSPFASSGVVTPRGSPKFRPLLPDNILLLYQLLAMGNPAVVVVVVGVGRGMNE